MENEDNEESRKRPFEEADNHHNDHHHHSSDAKKANNDIPLLKLLVPNYVAGALIGKGGAEMTEMQEKFGGTIKLSSSKDFYPGTSERIVVLTGEMNEIISLNDFIMEKLVTGEKKPNDTNERTEQVKIVLTNGAAGLLIGRGGATIKAIQEETKAKINITKRDEVGVVMGERVLTMSGSMEQRLNACRKVIEIVALEPSNVRNNIIKYTHAGVGNVITPAGANTIYIAPYDLGINSSGNSYGGGGGVTKAACRYKTNVHITMAVPDTMVGALLGKQGVNMREFRSYSGARIKFSEKNEFAPGTTDRVLNISGDVGQTDTALLLINQKIEQVHQQFGNEYDY